jgi:hypothetical protein
MTPIDVAVLALRLALVLVLYAFLAVVIRTAANELRQTGRTAGPVVAPSRSTSPARQGPRALRLLVDEPGTSGLAVGTLVELPAGGTMGRAAGCSLVLADSTVSSEHARVDALADRWRLHDLGSTNGTRLNGARLQEPVDLAPGDKLELGNVRLHVA